MRSLETILQTLELRKSSIWKSQRWDHWSGLLLGGGTRRESGCYCCCLVAKSRLTFTTPWTVARQAPFVSGVLQARILEWVAISSSRESSWPRNQTLVSCIGRWLLYHWATREAQRGWSQGWYPMLFLILFICLFLWLCLKAFRVLVPLPGTELMCPAVEVRCLNYWTTGEVPWFWMVRLWWENRSPQDGKMMNLGSFKWRVEWNVVHTVGMPKMKWTAGYDSQKRAMGWR